MWIPACCSRKASGIWDPSPAGMLLPALLVRLCLLPSKASSEAVLAAPVLSLGLEGEALRGCCRLCAVLPQGCYFPVRGLKLQLPSFQDQGVGSPLCCLVPCPVPAVSGCRAVPGEGCASGVEQGHGGSQPCWAGGPQVCLLPPGVSCAPEQGQSLAGLHSVEGNRLWWPRSPLWGDLEGDLCFSILMYLFISKWRG